MISTFAFFLHFTQLYVEASKKFRKLDDDPNTSDICLCDIKLIGNGKCNDDCNTKICNFDNGDCEDNVNSEDMNLIWPIIGAIAGLV